MNTSVVVMPLLELQRTQLREIDSMGISVKSLVPSELNEKKRKGKTRVLQKIRFIKDAQQLLLGNVCFSFSQTLLL